MDYYQIWCNLRDSTEDLAFSKNLANFMERLREKEVIADYRLTRRKLGLGPSELGEFHIIIMVRDLAQLEEAFQMVGKHGKETEELHKEVQKSVKDMKFAIYRDFPDKF